MVTNQNVSIVDSNETPVKNSAAGSLFSSESFDQIIPAVRTPITADSGGTQLQNIPCGKVWIRNGSGNQLMFIGGINEHAPYSGRGMSLYGGEIFIVPVKNTNVISLMASHSGEFVEYLGFLAGNNPNIALSGMYIAPDTTPPTVIAVSPTSGASGSFTTTDISATFSEDMDDTTITTSSFIVRLSGSSTPLSGSVACLTDPISGYVALFTPSSGIIQTSKVYNASLGTSITDMGGNPLQASGLWTWTTQAAPFIVSVQPTSGGSGIATNADISVVFSQQMASGTITAAAFTVRSGATSNVNLSGVAFLNSSDPTEAVFIPYSGIINTSGTYFARLATSITDAYGNPLNASGVWSWTTAPGAPPPDSTPPRVSGTTPISGASGVLVTADVLVNFSEQVQSGTVNTTNLFLRLSGNTIPAAVTLASDLKSATINPTNPLLNGPTYMINVLSGVKDLVGNFLSPYLSGKQFTTTPLTISGYSPASGETGVDPAVNIQIRSSAQLASGTISTATCYIQLSGETIPGDADLMSGLKTITIDPDNDLTFTQTYKLYVTSGVQDLNGNYLSNIISGQPFTIRDPAFNTAYTVSPTGLIHHLDNHRFRLGEKSALSTSPFRGELIQKVDVYMKRNGTIPSGSSGIIVQLRASPTSNTIKGVFGVKDPSTVSTTSTKYSFTNTNIVDTIGDDDVIEVQWLSGTASYDIEIGRANSNPVLGSYIVAYEGSNYSGASVVEYLDEDLVGNFYASI